MSVKTDKLVSDFASALKEKLDKAEKKYGFSDDWSHSDWQRDLVDSLSRHVRKGDPLDVAAYCAFAWHHGWSISPIPEPQLTDTVLKIDFSNARNEARSQMKSLRETVRLRAEQRKNKRS